MKTEENIQVFESVEDGNYKPQKSLIEKMEDYEHEIEGLKAENERLQKRVSELQAKTCNTDEHGYGVEEREKQVQELVQTLSRKDNEILILELKIDELSKEKENLTEGSDWLKQSMKELRSELHKSKITEKQTSNSETTLKQINQELARENEELKLTVRELREDINNLPVSIKVSIDRELNEKNCELAKLNNCYKNRVRKADWAMGQIETNIQMISSVINHIREEIVC
ncbi:MAG: hypothetical protein ABRQ38_15425 [Candidatus Eremiobacterota bacterium]